MTTLYNLTKENETETTDPTEINEPESTPPAQEVLPQEENVPREFENAEAPGESVNLR